MGYWSREPLAFHDLQRVILKLIDRVDAFAGFTQAELAELLGHAERRNFEPGDDIVREGSSGRHLYVLIDGEVEVSKRAGDRPADLARLGPGSSFGEMSIVDPAVRSATVTALTDCVLIRIADQACLRSPAVGAKLFRNVARILARRLRQTNRLAVGA